ncbi:MAG: Nif3-like dinuclear metal center hexameric protein [Gemmataceae bacterium]
MPTVADFCRFLADFAPSRLAADWDNVGLLLGEREANVERVMTCLTVTPESAAEAIAEKADLVVAHHPILFRGAKRLTSDTPEGGMLYRLARAGVAVYSPHTSFDNTAGGINDMLARRLGLEDVQPLQHLEETRQCKIVVFVPDQDLARVSDALFGAGAGVIGKYTQCSFRLPGKGTFFGSEETSPTIGVKGRREEVDEWRLEVLCPEAKSEEAVRAMRRAHSYEEPAFEVYPLRPSAGRLGVGRVGALLAAQRLDAFAKVVAARLGAEGAHIVGDPTRLVRKVAIVCGAGGELIGAAFGRADVLLTGEARFHDCLHAQAHGLCLVLPGHHATERCGVEELATLLAGQFSDVHIWGSQKEADPLLWVGRATHDRDGS